MIDRVPSPSRAFAVILPHTQLFGGVKRFFEIGNLLLRRGHQFLVFTPEGARPDWFSFEGEVLPLRMIRSYAFDAVFVTEVDFLKELEGVTARLKIFYAVLQRPYIKKVLRNDDIIVFANSENMYRYLNGKSNRRVRKAVGGIDLNKFTFKEPSDTDPRPLVVLVYGRFYRKKKGTLHVVRACERLYRRGYDLRLHLFDTPVDEPSREKVNKFTCDLPFKFFVDYPIEKVADLYYQADLFVSAERNAGWCNTGAEAMACGVPVIATRSGTQDFLFHEQTGLVVWRHSWFIEHAIKRMYDDPGLRRRLVLPARRMIEKFSWDNLALSIEEQVNTLLSDQGL